MYDTHSVESMLLALFDDDDALGDGGLGELWIRLSCPVTRSLMTESVAQRKTPMLDLAPTRSQEGVR